MKHTHLGEKLSKKHRKYIKSSLKYLRSRQCQDYQKYRDYGDPCSSGLSSQEAMTHFKKSAQGGLEILRKHGSEMLHQVRAHRKKYK